MIDVAVTGNPLREPKKLARKYFAIGLFAALILYIGRS